MKALYRTYPQLIGIAAIATGCTSTRLNRADQAYERMAYEKAGELYDAVPEDKLTRQQAINAAEAARLQNQYERAAQRFAQAESAEPLYGKVALHYGSMLMELRQRDAAAKIFRRVLEVTPEDREALDLYESSLSHLTFYKDSARFIVNELVLPGMVNVFSAVPYKKGLVVVGEQEPSAKKTNPWNGMGFLDLYYSEKRTIVRWLDAQPLPGNVNGPWHEGPVVFADNGRTMYFTRSHYAEHKLRKDEKDVSHLMMFRASLNEEDEWDNIHAFSYNGEDFSTGHPALSADGHTLYFASDRPGGYGGSDIWACADIGSGWGEPRNLGPTINTPGNELFPTVNGNTLYFSSTAHYNMGGLDIFSAQLIGKRWSDPKNLGYPVNTIHDDFGFVLDSVARSGYLSSDRTGADRIHSFVAPEKVIMLEAYVSDSIGFLENVSATITDIATEEVTTLGKIGSGRFSIPLKEQRDYDIVVEKEGYITARQQVSTKGLAQSDTLKADLKMTAIELNKPIAIENIYFDYDKWDIRPDAAVELDKIVTIIKDNPDLRFELGSHTDARGGDQYNLVLSDARANSTVDYLVRHGADPARIVAKGYGESKPVNKCVNGVKCSEEAHQANRRTEFTVTFASMASGK